MITVLEYLVIAAVVGAVVFVFAVLVFGRGERMAPLPAQTSPAELPDHGVSGADVRAVRFSLALRGYRMSDVDWTLDKLAQRIDELTGVLDRQSGGGAGGRIADPPADLAVAGAPTGVVGPPGGAGSATSGPDQPAAGPPSSLEAPGGAEERAGEGPDRPGPVLTAGQR